MPTRGDLSRAALAFAIALLCLVSPAHAQPEGPPAEDPVVAACLASFDSSQELRRERKLVAAKKELVACSQESCPSVVTVKCQQWLEEVRRSLPTVVIAAKSGKTDVFDVKVLVDEVIAHDSLTGAALELDPGPRKVVAMRGKEKRERTVLIREGHKNRLLEFDFTPPEKPKPRPVPVPVDPIEPGDGFSMPVLSWVGFAVGLTGVILGSIMGGIAISEGDKLQAECPGGRCDESFSGRFGPGETISHVSTVSFAVGGAGVALGIIGLIIGEDDDSEAGDERPGSSFGFTGRF